MTQEQFIDKACRWLVEHSHNSDTQDGITCTPVMTEGTLIEDFRKEMEDSAKRDMEEMMGMVSESIKTEWRDFSYIASELHRRKIETIINPERGDIQLRNEKTGKTLIFGNLLEVKAFALGLDWGVKNAEDMAFCGLLSPICKEEWK